MAETPSSTPTQASVMQRQTSDLARESNGSNTPSSRLQTELGKTTIADSVVSKIAGIAAREVSGVHALGSTGTGSLVSGLAQRVGASDGRGQGVKVEVGEREAAVDLSMSVDYGVQIPQVAEAVRRNIMNRIQSMTGLTVKEVNIDVSDLYFPEDDAASEQQRRVE